MRSQSILRLSDIDDNEQITENLQWNKNRLAWSFEGQGLDKRNLILRVAATNGNTKEADRELAVHGSCRIIEEHHKNATATYYNAIYFIKDNTLYRRTLLFREKFPQIAGAESHNGGAERFLEPGVCVTPSQKQTCSKPGEGYFTRCRPSDHWAFPNEGYTEPATDVVVLRNVSAFSIDYFNTPTSITPADHYTDLAGATDLAAVRKFTDIPNRPKDVRITITTSIQKFNNTTSTITLSTRGALPW